MNIKTAECVTPKHPDKLCDRISDTVVFECLKQDSTSRVAVETMGGHRIISVTGELTTNAYVNINEIVKSVVGEDYGVQVNVVKQSLEISKGVDKNGAGDQGIMVGYACNENEEMIPQELYLARNLCKFIYKQYQEDGKTQITLKDGAITCIVASFCNVSSDTLKEIIEDWLQNFTWDSELVIHTNPAGDWSQGGFEADTGVTGRKLACDNYGPQIPLGGGAFSGKDATKVDRSGAYMARRMAVDYLRNVKGAKEVMVKLSYAIGVAEPVMVSVEIDGKQVNNSIKYDLTPNGMIEFLGLRKVDYREVAKWGSMGNGFNWDK